MMIFLHLLVDIWPLAVVWLYILINLCWLFWFLGVKAQPLIPVYTAMMHDTSSIIGSVYEMYGTTQIHLQHLFLTFTVWDP